MRGSFETFTTLLSERTRVQTPDRLRSSEIPRTSLSRLHPSRKTGFVTTMTSVDEILNFQKDEESLYAILGCDESSSVEQIIAEYKARALQYHPDKNDGDKDAEIKFQKLKEAKEILTDPERRKNYDKWLNSGVSISYKNWLGMKEHVHQSMHWTTFKTKDRMLEGEGASGVSGKAPAANRRASEGGANIHWGARSNVQWDTQASSDVVNKFRNYEI